MRRTNRLAFTLIELLVVMTAGMTVLSLTIGMIQKTMSIAATNQARMDQSIVIDRLAREFRHDAHRALAFEVNQGVQFTLHDGSVIHYRDQENRVARTQSIDGRPMASERFELGEGQLAAFGSPQPDQVRLTIQNTLPQPRLRRSIQAVVGRWAIPEANRGESR